MRIFLIILVVVVLLIFAFISFGRKDFPYDLEIVPLDKKIIIYNTTGWSERDCVVHITDHTGDERRDIILNSKEKSVVIGDVSNGRKYKLKIYRNDIFGKLMYRPFVEETVPVDETKKYFVLVGASIGKHWRLSKWTERVNSKKVFYGYRGTYSFDKEKLIDSLVNVEAIPDGIIIKECAAYFPRGVDESVSTIDRWANKIKEKGAVPVLATVVPVTVENETDNPGRMDSINKFNDMIRELCVRKGYTILDLQAALSEGGSKNGYLDKKYAVEDGLHLNKYAYEVLDNLLMSLSGNGRKSLAFRRRL